MIISIWRYSHLALAVSSFLLLTLASLTGIVLAFEPVVAKSQPYKVDGFDEITLARCIPVIKEKLHGIQTLTVDENDFVIASYSDEKSNDKTAYIHPLTGAVLGQPRKQSALFEWTTSLHRSLFLHETGRLIIGITAFLLILITLSGIALVIQRQKGIRRFFAPIEKTSFAQYYHVVFGRATLLFILALALSGTYLSISRFIIKPQKAGITVDEEDIKEEPQKKLADFALFQHTKLSEINTIEFPFSEFPEDYYKLKLHDREVCVNQITGDILAQQLYPKSTTLATFSLRWHTGRSSAIWAILMAITAGYILFFIYSGLVITWKRIRNKSKNQYKAAECRIIILVGSENGSTYAFASAVYQQLLKKGEKVYLEDLDKYALFPRAEHLIVMTSTYGEGDPPSNARKFAALVEQHPQLQPVQFSVVGFGSRSYEHYCQFAYHTNHLLHQQSWAIPATEMATINDRSPEEFSSWLDVWTQRTGFTLAMPRALLGPPQKGMQQLRVVSRTGLDADNVFIISFAPAPNQKIASGDLLAIYPKNDHRERLYSIGMVDGNIQLCVKYYPHGLGSDFLNSLKAGDNIYTRIIKNQHFHFPDKASGVLLISNGTGIAPFLGMINTNHQGLSIQLYCGFRTQASFHSYQSFLEASINIKRLKQYHLALSRENEKQYVSHLFLKDKVVVGETLTKGGILMLCGSLSMQKDILLVLENICREASLRDVEFYRDNGQIRTDCY